MGEELLDKYGSAERALVTEYGCLEGLLEECGWEELEEEEDGSPHSICSSKKNVRFNDVEKTHLFSSKTSIVNQLANDDKRSVRLKMKQFKKQLRIERRLAQRADRKFDYESFKKKWGYNSYDECTSESEGGGVPLIE